MSVDQQNINTIFEDFQILNDHTEIVKKLNIDEAIKEQKMKLIIDMKKIMWDMLKLLYETEDEDFILEEYSKFLKSKKT